MQLIIILLKRSYIKAHFSLMSKNYRFHIIVTLLIVSVLTSCSRKKDKFLNRNFHAMGSYYNIIYNGNLALSEGQEQLAASYKENYWDILPIERLEITTVDGVRTEAKNEKFKRAEEKATKAIQKHSMYMGGKEYNPQIDEAFLLLGKSRYFDQRFIPAKDALSFILTHYPKSSTINEVEIWLQKTNLRLGYYQEAIDNLINLIDTKNLEPEISVLANSTLAEAYIITENLSDAITPLTTAIQLTKNNDFKGRMLYVKSQLFQQLEETDSAYASLNQIIELNRKTPRDYRIHSFLEQKKLKDYTKVHFDSTVLFFQDLSENRENRPYLDFIFYEEAQFFRANDSLKQAIISYNKSLKENPQDRYLKAQDYKELGDIYFNRANYITAGKYYDSTLVNLTKRTREKLRIKKKRENLVDVIKFEGIAKTNDSILWLVNANKKQRIDYFETYIDSLKAEAESVFASEDAIQLGSDFKRRESSRSSASSGSSSFYNEKSKKRSFEKFKETWGNIKLTDNWRTNPQSGSFASKDVTETTEEDKFTAPEFQVETYIAQIPTKKAMIDSINDERNFAYYQLGIIYKEKFKRLDLASAKLEAVLQQQPEERLVLPSKYYLYKIYQETGQSALKEKWKNDILNNYPESNYAKIIRNPKALLEDENSPSSLYYKTYKQFESGQFKAVLENSNKYSAQFTGTSIVPKFELLKAKAIGRTQGLKAYKTALNYVALTFPQSEEGKYAQQLYNTVDQNFIKNKFEKPDEDATFKLVYELQEQNHNSEKLKELINKFLIEEGLNFKVTVEFYTDQIDFLIIHGLNSKLGAEGLAKKLKQVEELLSIKYFTASSNNYKVIQIYKNKNEYLETQS